MKSAMIEMTAAELEGTCGGASAQEAGALFGEGVDLLIAALKKIGRGFLGLVEAVKEFFGLGLKSG